MDTKAWNTVTKFAEALLTVSSEMEKIGSTEQAALEAKRRLDEAKAAEAEARKALAEIDDKLRTDREALARVEADIKEREKQIAAKRKEIERAERDRLADAQVKGDAIIAEAREKAKAIEQESQKALVAMQKDRDTAREDTAAAMKATEAAKAELARVNEELDAIARGVRRKVA